MLVVSCGAPGGTAPPTPDTVATIVAGTLGALVPQAASSTPIATMKVINITIVPPNIPS